MKLKGQFLLISGIPLIGIAITFVIGLVAFSQIQSDIGHLRELDEDMETILNADRDAYQVYVSELNALESLSMDELKGHDDSNRENLDQVWERVVGPGEHFTDNMQTQFNRFKKEYALWEVESRGIIEISLEMFEDEGIIAESEQIAADSFGVMRDLIDKIGELIDEELGGSLSSQRRRSLERALSLVLNGDRDAYQAYLAQIQAHFAETYEEIQSLDESNLENIQQTGERVLTAARLFGGRALDLVNDFQQLFDRWSEASRTILELEVEIFSEELQRDNHLAASHLHFDEMRDSIDKLGEMQSFRTDEEFAKIMADLRRMIVQFIIVFSVSSVISLIASFLISRSLLKSIGSNIGFAEEISRGNLTLQLDSTRKDEMGDLNRVLESMRLKLKEIILSVKESSSYVSSGSQQLSDSAQRLSSGASEQAASTEEVTSSVDEISSSIEQNNDNAMQTRSISENVSVKAAESGKAVSQTVEAMKEIAEKIGIVSEIANQTNLLALNAAIEAARAGDSGKGFAVVAAEVRKLAESSRKSAQMITDLTSSSLGVAEEAGQMIIELVEEIDKTRELVQEISSSSSEQAQGMMQINTALIQLDKVTQENASFSEEIASTSEELAAQAGSLESEMNFFNV